MSGHYTTVAKKGNIFVLTESGYEHCLRFCKSEVIRERKIGQSVGEYTDYVPNSWLKKGWVKEISKI